MNSTKRFLKSLLLIYGLLCSLSSFANPVTWELTFTNDLYGYYGGAVERGTVTFNPTTNTIDSFSFDNGYGPGTNHNFSGTHGEWGSESSSWHFGSEQVFEGTFYNFIQTLGGSAYTLGIYNFIQTSETSWTGDWSEMAYDAYPPEEIEMNILGGGTVTATLITNYDKCEPAEYTQNTGKISISTLTIENKQYDVTLKKQGGYDFKITHIARDKESDCVQAEYISNKGEIRIPVMMIKNKKYKVTLKKQSGYNFTITHISRIR